MNWANVQVPNINSDDAKEKLQISNSALSIPTGLRVQSGWVSLQECGAVVDEFDKGGSSWAGFDQRRRVQSWSVDDTDFPDCLRHLSKRLHDQTGYQPSHVSIEEYPRSQLQRKFSTSKTLVTTFESPVRGSDSNNFVAVLPIASSIIEAVNRPKTRSADCWELYSELNHSAGMLLCLQSLYLKTGEFLWDWRSNMTAVGSALSEEESTSEDRYIIVKFKNLPSPETTDSTEEHKDLSDFGYRPGSSAPRNPDDKMPALKDLLTIIVTTSPIKSNPSTELLERVFDTFLHGGKEFALRCRKVIVCDGCREKNSKVSKRHANSKQAMRNGIVDATQLENYGNFKSALRKLCHDAPEESPFANTFVEELPSRHGYGFALRHALRECVKTPYVIVIQHDRTFMRRCPIEETVRAMWYNPEVKYCGMSMRSNLMYRDIFLGKFGKGYKDDLSSCTLRRPELLVDSTCYGPNSDSTSSMDFRGQERLKENILALAETYRTSQQNAEYIQWLEDNPVPPGKSQMSLTPTFFWYDNVHICETEFYRDFVFNPKYKMVVKGGFVEDKLSPVIKKTVERLGLADAHKRFGCFLLDDHSGMFFTGHLDGGSYLTKSEKDSIVSALERPTQ